MNFKLENFFFNKFYEMFCERQNYYFLIYFIIISFFSPTLSLNVCFTDYQCYISLSTLNWKRKKKVHNFESISFFFPKCFYLLPLVLCLFVFFLSILASNIQPNIINENVETRVRIKTNHDPIARPDSIPNQFVLWVGRKNFLPLRISFL